MLHYFIKILKKQDLFLYYNNTITQ